MLSLIGCFSILFFGWIFINNFSKEYEESLNYQSWSILIIFITIGSAVLLFLQPSGWYLSFRNSFLWGMFVGSLMCLCYIDSRFGVLPNRFIFAMFCSGYFLSLHGADFESASSWSLTIFMILMLSGFLFERLIGRNAMGLGDVKFCATAAFFSQEFFSYIIIVAVAIAVVEMSCYFLKYRSIPKVFPFGPHLICAFLGFILVKLIYLNVPPLNA